MHRNRNTMYLGVILDSNNRIQVEINARIKTEMHVFTQFEIFYH